MGPLPIGDDATYVQQYDDGHIPWVKRPGDDLGDTGAMVIPKPDQISHNCARELLSRAADCLVYCVACTVAVQRLEAPSLVESPRTMPENCSQ